MRITKLKLKNFAPIWAGMQRKEIEIDFAKSKNRIILLIGENGSGKTAILSQLHPFAHAGSMDIRSGSEMILPTTEGYKEIHYEKNDNKYVIKHYYRETGVKSFISRNGEELNPNGNVKPFADLISLEFSIDSDMMKLLRLGANVTNFSREGSAKRKSFMANMMSDIDLYLRRYKKVNQDSRLLKQLIKTTSDKIQKLNIYDEAVELEALELEKTYLSAAQTNLNYLHFSIGQVENQISSLLNNLTFEEVKFQYSELKTQHETVSKDIDKLLKKIKTISQSIDCTVTVDELTSKKHALIVEKTIDETHFSNVMDTLNKLYEEKRKKEDSLRFVTREDDYSSTVELFIKLNREYDSLKPKYSNFNASATKSDLLTALGGLQEIDSVREAIHAFDDKAIKIVLGLHRSGDSVKSYVKSNLDHIESKIRQIELESSKEQFRWTNPDNDVYVLYEKPECGGMCPYRQFYEDVTRPQVEEKSTIASMIYSLENEKDYFMKFYDIKRNLEIIDRLIKSNHELNKKIPFDLFNKSNIYDNIKLNQPVYDEEFITNIISEVEKYEHFVQLSQRMRDVERDKLAMEKTRGNLSDVQEALTKIDLHIVDIEKDRDTLRKAIDDKANNLAEMTLHIDALKLRNEEMDKLENLNITATTIMQDITQYEEKLQQVEVYQTDLVDKNRQAAQSQADIEFRNNNILQIQHKLIEFRSLNKEMKKLNTQYDDVEIIRKALSSTQGIPLLFMQLYLKNTRAKVNQLLDVVYDGKLELAEFVIDEKEFRIPYVKSGIQVSDISRCSQGEDTFISLAFTFSLISQSFIDMESENDSHMYNIPLFDEIDATLDMKKRSQFLAILENLLDSIWSEQVFLITHNNVFDSYPVDVIMTSDTSIDNLKNTNVIWSVN